MENIPRDVHVTNLARNFQFCPSLDIVKLFPASLCLLDLRSLCPRYRDPDQALQKSLSGVNADSLATDSISPFLNIVKSDTTTTTPTVLGLSCGSDPETAPKRQRSAIPAAGGMVSKRKSRATKRSQTTFITADPSNFRQMVQQVTGMRFGNSPVLVVLILKPKPQRLGSRLQGPRCLPILDTPAFLLDHHQQQVVGPNSAAGAVTGVSLQKDKCT